MKGKVENVKRRGKKYGNDERTFFFFFNFLKRLKFVLGIPK